MKRVKVLSYFIIFILIHSCQVNKAVKYLKEGKTDQKNYKVIIPFELKDGYIIIPVSIQNKNYNFLLDTGAPSLVSKELAESLNLKVIDSVKVGDVFNEEKSNKYARLESIKIGTIDFVGTVALINDFNAFPIWSSLNVDGFIGANLMQHAIWDIDFNERKITITDDESILNIPQETIENKLFIGHAGIPSIACKVNGRKVWNFVVDFGFNGGIVIPFSEFEKQIEKGEISDFSNPKTPVTGIFGNNDTTRKSYTGIIKEIEFGNVTLENQKVYAEQYLGQLFGVGFFRDYRVVLNWKTKKIKLIDNKEITSLN